MLRMEFLGRSGPSGRRVAIPSHRVNASDNGEGEPGLGGQMSQSPLIGSMLRIGDLWAGQEKAVGRVAIPSHRVNASDKRRWGPSAQVVKSRNPLSSGQCFGYFSTIYSTFYSMWSQSPLIGSMLRISTSRSFHRWPAPCRNPLSSGQCFGSAKTGDGECR